MTNEKFTEIVKNRLSKIEELLITKGAEYAPSGTDRLHNFKVGATITGKSPAEVLDGYMLKHYISYRDILKEISEGKQISRRKIDEKIGDILVYLLLQEAVLEDSGLIKE